jgi:hypothetical protein
MPYAKRAACLCSVAVSGVLAVASPLRAQEPAATNSKPAVISEKPPQAGRSSRKGRRGKPHQEAAASGRQTSSVRAKSYSRAKIDEVNTWLIFGFIEGSDVGDKGEWTLSHDSVVRSAAQGPAFAALDGGVGVGYSPTNRAVISLTATPSFEGNAGATSAPNGANGVSAHALGASASFKYQLFRRDEAPMGLAIQISPYWQRTTTGPLEQTTLGSEVRLLADRVLVPDRWFAALNVAYQPHHDAYSDGSSFRKTTAEISGAVSRKVLNNLFVGAEIRHVSKYQGFAFEGWTGDAVYAGPTAFMLLGEQGYVGVAWSARIMEQATVNLGQLPDDTFDRHQLRLKAGISF